MPPLLFKKTYNSAYSSKDFEKSALLKAFDDSRHSIPSLVGEIIVRVHHLESLHGVFAAVEASCEKAQGGVAQRQAAASANRWF